MYTDKQVEAMRDKYRQASILLAIALGTQERCREDIDEKYNKDIRELYQVRELVGMSKSRIFERYTVTTSEYIKKAYTIILNEMMKRKDLFITKLIKKAYKPAYTYYTHNREVLFEAFIEWYYEKEGGLENISGIYLDYCCYVMVYLSATTENKIIKGQLYKNIQVQYLTLLKGNSIEEMLPDILDDEIKTATHTMSDIKEEADFSGYEDFLEQIKYRGKFGDDISMVFENIRLKEEEEYLLNNNIYTLKPHAILATAPMTRITNVLSIVLEIFEFDNSVIREAKIDEDMITGIVKYIHVIKNANDITDEEVRVVIFSAFVIYALTKEYNNLRQVHYEKIKNQLIEQEIENEKKQTELEQSLRKELDVANERYKQTKKSLTDTTNELKLKTKQLNDLERKLKRTELELQKAKENDKELEFLREYYFNSIKFDNDDNLELEGENVNIIEKIKNLEGVIVGGHNNVHSKLKEILPNFIFVGVDDVGRNLSFIRNKDIVFLISTYNNHNLYKKVMNELKVSDMKLSYLSGSSNIRRLCGEIYARATETGILKGNRKAI